MLLIEGGGKGKAGGGGGREGGGGVRGGEVLLCSVCVCVAACREPPLTTAGFLSCFVSVVVWVCVEVG